MYVTDRAPAAAILYGIGILLRTLLFIVFRRPYLCIIVAVPKYGGFPLLEANMTVPEALRLSRLVCAALEVRQTPEEAKRDRAARAAAETAYAAALAPAYAAAAAARADRRAARDGAART